jgi:protein involved in polysaccharide export with SLBB domain
VGTSRHGAAGPVAIVIPALACFLALAVTSAPISAQSADSQAVAGQANEILLRPGDVIKLSVWREPDWSGEFAVNESGTAVLPKIGPVHVTSMSPDELRQFVVDSLGRFLRNPSIEVTPLRRIQVLGAVRNPGLYSASPTHTVGDVLALAGGSTSDGKTDQVLLKRDGHDFDISLGPQTRLADTPIRTGDQLFVPERGWVSRNGGLVAAGVTATMTLIVALLVR